MTAHAEDAGFKVRGWHVLAAMVGFFSIIFAVNIVFITLALGSFPGEEERRSYMQGLAYNEVIDERRAQANLGWRAAANLVDDRVLIRVTDASDGPVTGLALEGALQHPADMEFDRALRFTEVRAGVYAAPVEDLPDGRWILSAQAIGDTPFEMERELWLR